MGRALIKFFGTIKNQIQADVTNKRIRQVGIVMFAIAVGLLILSLIVYLIFKEEDVESYRNLVLLCLIAVIVSCFGFRPVKPNKLRFEWIYNITITNDLITVDVLFQNNVVLTHPVKAITKVEDYGEYYYLFVHRWESTHGIVCQKDLLVEGTLEEFEKLFAGKIIRKIK